MEEKEMQIGFQIQKEANFLVPKAIAGQSQCARKLYTRRQNRKSCRETSINRFHYCDANERYFAI